MQQGRRSQRPPTASAHRCNLELAALPSPSFSLAQPQRTPNPKSRISQSVIPKNAYGLPEWLRISIGTSAENQKCKEALAAIFNENNNRPTIGED